MTFYGIISTKNSKSPGWTSVRGSPDRTTFIRTLVFTSYFILKFGSTYLDNIINFKLMMARHEPEACLNKYNKKRYILKFSFAWLCET